MSTLRSLKRFQHATEKRASLEEKTKIFEENARKAKLSIDRQLLAQVLQEENRSHEDAVKELNEKLEEENRTHDDAAKELEEKIADLDMQLKSSSEAEGTPETPSESILETTESPQETPIEGEEPATTDAFQDVRVMLQEESKPAESEIPPEAPKKKRRGLF